MNSTAARLILPVSIMSALMAVSSLAETFHVWTNSSCDGPGTTWSNAFHSIQSAVDVADWFDIVLVTNGIYKTDGAVTPGYQLANRVCVTSRYLTIRSVNGPEFTTIAGAGASGGGCGSNAVRGAFIGQNCSLKGFTITNGHTMLSGTEKYNRYGGGVYLEDSATLSNCWVKGNSGYSGAGVYLDMYATLNNCTLEGNSATNYGGGAYLDYHASLSSCVLCTNAAKSGGGAYLKEGSQLTNCTLEGNSAIGAPPDGGGGAFLYYGGTVSDCELTDNSAANCGGAVFLFRGGTVTNCVLATNCAYCGGGIYVDSVFDGQVFIQDCIFNVNTADLGGAAFLLGSEGIGGGVMLDCAFNGNMANNAGGVYLNDGGYVDNSIFVSNWANFGYGGAKLFLAGIVDGCTFEANSAWSGGGAGLYGGTLTNCTLKANNSTANGGAVYLQSDGALYDCYFANNSTDYSAETDTRGGAIYFVGDGAICSSCVLVSNRADSGGGIYVSPGSDGVINNCLMLRNIATEWGGGSRVDGLCTNLSFKNCTVVANEAVVGGGIELASGEIHNCIVWSNSATTGQDIRNRAAEAILHTCASTGVTNGIDGCTTNAPLFVSHLPPNYHLQPVSPCIDAGSTPLMFSSFDLDAIPRPLDGDNDGSAVVDMGCYEYVNPSADSDGDQIPDGWENDSGLNAASSNAPSANADSDPFTDIEEYIADTQPTNAASYLAISDITHNSPIRVHFSSSTNRLYTLKSCSNILATNWIPVPGQGPREGVGDPDLMIDTNGLDQSFYRIHVELP